jgi:hypothetical protein
MVALGYGRWVRADRIDSPLVASRSEKAILADVETALTEAAGVPRRRSPRSQVAGQRPE